VLNFYQINKDDEIQTCDRLCEASCIVGKVNNVKHQIGAANSTMLGTNSVPLAAPIRCHLQHQLVPLCPLLGCLPINRQCIQAYFAHHKRGRKSERGKVIPHNYEVFVRE